MFCREGGCLAGSLGGDGVCMVREGVMKSSKSSNAVESLEVVVGVISC